MKSKPKPQVTKARQGAKGSGRAALPTAKKRTPGATKAPIFEEDLIAAHLGLIGTALARGLGDVAKALGDVADALRDEGHDQWHHDAPEAEPAPASVTTEGAAPPS